MTEITRLALFAIPILASGCGSMVDAALSQSSTVATVQMKSHEEVKAGTGKTYVVRGSSEARIEGAQKIQMWADIDVKYRKDVMIHYQIKVYQGRSLLHVFQDDPMFSLSEGGTAMFMMTSFTPDYWSVSDLFYPPSPNRTGIQKDRYQRLLDCDFTPTAPGNYRFEVEQTFAGQFVEINKSDLILKQKFR